MKLNDEWGSIMWVPSVTQRTTPFDTTKCKNCTCSNRTRRISSSSDARRLVSTSGPRTTFRPSWTLRPSARAIGLHRVGRERAIVSGNPSHGTLASNIAQIRQSRVSPEEQEEEQEEEQ